MPIARQVSFTLPEQSSGDALRAQRLAAALQAQSAMPEAQTVPGYPGPWVVQPSPLEYAGKLAGQAAMQYREGKQQKEQEAKNLALAEALRTAWSNQQQPQVPPEAAPPQQAPFAQPAGMPNPAQPAPAGPAPASVPSPVAPTPPPSAAPAVRPAQGPMLGGVPIEVWMGASPDQRQLMAQLVAERDKDRERNAYVFKPTGEVDPAATHRNLAGIDPRLGLQFQRDQQQYESAMTNASLRNEETQRKIRADEERRQKGIRDAAINGALQQVFDIIQRGGSEQDAIAQGGQFYTAALQSGGMPAERFDPSGMGFTEEGEILPAGGGLQQVASKAPAPPPPGMAPTPEELSGQPQSAPGAGQVPKDYNWQLAYLYTAKRLPKYNPQTADIVLDYRTGQPMENLPRTQIAERRAKAGASNVTVGDFGKPAANKLEEGMINAADGIRRIEAVRKSFDPSYLTLGTQWKNIISAGKERLGMDLSPEAKANLRDFTKFKRRTLANINQYIKDITGAAMSEPEARRITATMPNMDDSPEEFQSKMNDVLDQLSDTLEAYEEARAGGPGALKPYTRAPRGAPQPGAPQPINPQPRKSTPKGGAIDFNQLK